MLFSDVSSSHGARWSFCVVRCRFSLWGGKTELRHYRRPWYLRGLHHSIFCFMQSFYMALGHQQLEASCIRSNHWYRARARLAFWQGRS